MQLYNSYIYRKTLDELEKNISPTQDFSSTKKSTQNTQGGPLLVLNGVLTPIIGDITPVTNLFSAIYKGYKLVYNWFLGPPCA